MVTPQRDPNAPRQRYQLFGGLGSPYSMKMRAVLRYRRLPYVFRMSGPGAPEIAHVKPPVIPVIQFLDGSFHVDSTPMIDELEALHPGRGAGDARSIVPDDPALAFLAFLLEDFADEWGTKWMFHYRWFREIDQQTFSRWGAFDRLGGGGRAKLEAIAKTFRERQVGRMALVGCTEHNRPLIEGTFEAALDILESHVTEAGYLFGTRPSRADFALYGQLSQLASDPTPDALIRRRAPYTYRWITQLDDACGVEGSWLAADAPLPEVVRALLQMCAEVYFPFLRANAAALEAGEESFSFRARGLDYDQAPFKYQRKCLAELRRRFASLEGAPRARVEAVLKETGGLETLAD